MAAAPPDRPLGILARDLVIAAVLAAVLLVLFVGFNGRLLHGFTAAEVLLLEGGAVVLVAFLVARAVTNALNAVLARQGLGNRGHAVRLFVNLLIAIATTLALFKLSGVSAESILLSAGLTGVVLGLASQTVLANVFAGILLVFADPFRPGDRVGFITWQFGILGSSYPHESVPPTYTGTVEDVGLTYTVVALDVGGYAKIPNGIVIQALVVLPRGHTVHRVRFTLPRTTALAAVEATLPELSTAFPPPYPGAPTARVEVADLAATSWDAVVVVATDNREPNTVRDRVLRIVRGKLDAPAAARP